MQKKVTNKSKTNAGWSGKILQVDFSKAKIWEEELSEELINGYTGGVTVLVWKQFGWLELYEIVPGFVLAVIAIVAVSLLDKEPSEDIRREFELSRL